MLCFILFYFIVLFDGNFQVQAPGDLCLEGQFNGGFLCYAFGVGLIFGILRYQMTIYIFSFYSAFTISAVIIIIIIVVVINAVYGIIVQPFSDAKYHKHNTRYTKHNIKAKFYCINGKC